MAIYTRAMRTALLAVGCVWFLTFTVWAEDDLATLSDEFNEPASLRDWQRVHEVEGSSADQLEGLDVDRTRPGNLVLIPRAVVWYQDYRGPLLFKPVAGDFVVSTSLVVGNRAGTGAPESAFSLAGLMIRSPREVDPQSWRPGGEIYVFLSLGAADRPGTFQFEVKTTVDSRSTLEISEGAAAAELKAARIGEVILLLRKLPGSDWQVHRRYRRADFPETLQVGIACYTDWPTCQAMDPAAHNQTAIDGGRPDLTAAVDYVRFARPTVPADWAGRDLADPAAVSDEQILEALQ